MAGLAVERLRVAPICQLCRRAPGVARVGKLGEDAPEVGSGLVLVAGERPAFRQAGEILAAIVLAEPVEVRSAERERGLEIGGGAACQLGPPVAGGAAPNERFRVTGVLVELVLDDLERARQRRFIAAEAAEHVVADLLVEALLRQARGAAADCGGRDRDGNKSAPFHGGLPLARSQSTLFHRVSDLSR